MLFLFWSNTKKQNWCSFLKYQAYMCRCKSLRRFLLQFDHIIFLRGRSVALASEVFRCPQSLKCCGKRNTWSS